MTEENNNLPSRDVADSERSGDRRPSTYSPSSILAAKWREKADHCEAEIERSKGKKSTLYLSVEGRICYEQAARTLRQCADEIHSLENVQVETSPPEPQ